MSNLAIFSPSLFDARHGFFRAAVALAHRAVRSPILGGVSVMAEKARKRPNQAENQPLARPVICPHDRLTLNGV
jgi:hypothetical protein